MKSRQRKKMFGFAGAAVGAAYLFDASTIQYLSLILLVPHHPG